jgi:hypothetical protein
MIGCAFLYSLRTKVVTGHRLRRPRLASASLYDVMMACWSDARPSFHEIIELLMRAAPESHSLRSITIEDTTSPPTNIVVMSGYSFLGPLNEQSPGYIRSSGSERNLLELTQVRLESAI